MPDFKKCTRLLLASVYCIYCYLTAVKYQYLHTLLRCMPTCMKVALEKVAVGKFCLQWQPTFGAGNISPWGNLTGHKLNQVQSLVAIFLFLPGSSSSQCLFFLNMQISRCVIPEIFSLLFLLSLASASMKYYFFLFYVSFCAFFAQWVLPKIYKRTSSVFWQENLTVYWA